MSGYICGVCNSEPCRCTAYGDMAFEQRERVKNADDHLHRCRRAMDATAARLGLDPVAFAEACQDGSFLDDAVLLAGNKRPLTVVESQLLDRWLDKLAALKRAEPKP